MPLTSNHVLIKTDSQWLKVVLSCIRASNVSISVIHAIGGLSGSAAGLVRGRGCNDDVRMVCLCCRTRARARL